MDESTLERSQAQRSNSDVGVLFQRARELRRRLSAESTVGGALDAERVGFAHAAQRLTDCVIRPLNVLSGFVSDESVHDDDDIEATGTDLIDCVCSLAEEATTLSTQPDVSGGLIEATAALQDIACRLTQAVAPERATSLLGNLGRSNQHCQ